MIKGQKRLVLALENLLPYMYCLLIDKNLCKIQNVLIKFPWALLVYMCLSYRDLCKIQKY